MKKEIWETLTGWHFWFGFLLAWVLFDYIEWRFFYP